MHISAHPKMTTPTNINASVVSNCTAIYRPFLLDRTTPFRFLVALDFRGGCNLTVEASLSTALVGRSPAMQVLDHIFAHAQIASVLNQLGRSDTHSDNRGYTVIYFLFCLPVRQRHCNLLSRANLDEMRHAYSIHTVKIKAFCMKHTSMPSQQ